jgi:hypothetical protein
MRTLIKRVLPADFRRVAGRVVANLRARRLAKLSVAEAFDEIYRKEYWKQGTSLSGVGSEGEWVQQYCQLVGKLAKKLELRTAVDAGCGDFNVGRELAASFQRYTALDVSGFIIRRNKAAFANLRNVEFRVSNLIEEIPPRVDIVMIRQVLQHLTNAQIARILQNVEASGSRYLLVAEEQPAHSGFIPNHDLGSHSVLTRLDAGSAVDITAPPFSRIARLVATFPAPGAGGTSQLAVHLVALG